MRKAILFIFVFIISFSANGQCDCSSKFASVRYEMEHNYAGYNDKVNNTTKESYRILTETSEAKAKTSINDAYCLAILDKWLNFFKDNHVQLNFSASSWINAKDTTAIYAKAATTETIIISPEQLNELKKKNDKNVEGIYYSSPDTNYMIAVIKNKNDFRDFAGVVISSKNVFWKPGQVKLEFQKPEKGSVYPGIVHDRSHNAYPMDFAFNGTSFGDNDWIKIGHTPAKVSVPREKQQPIQVKKLSDNTLYIQILTFDAKLATRIDSVFKANEALLKSMPNLVLDLRNNGGGADFSYQPILPYLYTQPVVGIGNDVLASPDNIRRKKDMLNNPDMPNEVKEMIRNSVSEMELKLGNFVMQASNDISTREKVEPFPKKVVLLINKGCASSTEEFLLEARQSKKVTLMGEHTSGTLDYSNMLSADLPCKDLTFKYASTRSRRIDVGQGIDNVGILPSIVLSDEQDWIKEAQQFLEKK